jgi:hypothetical protein
VNVKTCLRTALLGNPFSLRFESLPPSSYICSICLRRIFFFFHGLASSAINAYFLYFHWSLLFLLFYFLTFVEHASFRLGFIHCRQSFTKKSHMIYTADSTGEVFHFPRSRLKVHRHHQHLKSTLQQQSEQIQGATIIEPVFILRLRKAPIAYNLMLVSQWETSAVTKSNALEYSLPNKPLNDTSNQHTSVSYILTSIKVEWPGLYVYTSLIPNSGLGVFTCTPLKKGTMIPYLGCLQNITAMKHPMYSMWAGALLVWNAAPELNPLKNFMSSTNFGPFLPSRINQSNATLGFPSNLTIQQEKQLKHDAVYCKANDTTGNPFQMYLLATQNIAAGEELLVRYNRRGC